MQKSASDSDWLKTRSASSWSLRPTACETRAIAPTPSICVMRHDDEHRGARGADAGERRVAEARDEVEVDQEIERLGQHAGRDGRGHGHEMARGWGLGSGRAWRAPELGVGCYPTAGAGGQANDSPGGNRETLEAAAIVAAGCLRSPDARRAPGDTKADEAAIRAKHDRVGHGLQLRRRRSAWPRRTPRMPCCFRRMRRRHRAVRPSASSWKPTARRRAPRAITLQPPRRRAGAGVGRPRLRIRVLHGDGCLRRDRRSPASTSASSTGTTASGCWFATPGTSTRRRHPPRLRPPTPRRPRHGLNPTQEAVTPESDCPLRISRLTCDSRSGPRPCATRSPRV